MHHNARRGLVALAATDLLAAGFVAAAAPASAATTTINVNGGIVRRTFDSGDNQKWSRSCNAS